MAANTAIVMPNISSNSFNNILPVPFLQSAVLNTIDNDTVGLNMEILLKSLKNSGKRKKWYDSKAIRSGLMVCVCLVSTRRTLARLLNNTSYMRSVIRSPRPSLNVKKIYLDFDAIDKFSTDNNVEIINMDRGEAVENVKMSVKTSVSTRSIAKEGYLACLITPYLAPRHAHSFGYEGSTVNGLSNEKGKLEFTMGETRIESLLRGGKPPSTSLLFTLEDSISGTPGQVWAGPVHYYRPPPLLPGTRVRPPGSFMAGASHDHAHAHSKLNMKQVANKKILDLRFKKNGTTQFKKYKSINERLQNRFRTKSNVFKNGITKQRSYFSPILFSTESPRLNSQEESYVTAGGAVKFFFAFNAASAARDGARFSYLYNNNSTLAKAIQIHEITVHRKRVRWQPGISELAGAPRATSNYDRNQKEELVCKLTDGSLKQLQSTNTPSGIFQFVGSDLSATQFSTGLYQYRVYVTYTDESSKKLTDAVHRLSSDFARYTSYVRLATHSPGFNASTNSFDKKIIDYLYTTTTSWSDVVNSYLGVTLDLFGSEAFQETSIDEWQRNLLILTDPRSATPSSLLIMEKIVQELLSTLTRQISSTSPITCSLTKGETLNFSSKIYGARRNFTPAPVVLSHKFSSAYNANQLNLGRNYINDLEKRPGVLSSIGYRKWSARISREKKYYSGVSFNEASINVNGYLSLESIVTPQKTISRQEMTFENGLPLLKNKLDPIGENIFNDASDLSIKSDILTLNGISIRPLRVDIKDVLESDQGCLSYIDSKDVFGADSNFVLEDKTSTAACSGPSGDSIPGDDEVKIEGASTDDDKILNTDMVDSIINSIPNDFNNNLVVDPSSIGASPAAAALNLNLNDLVEKGSFDFDSKYNSCMVVEYLIGYETGMDGPVVSAPMWKQLDEGDLNRAREGRQALICRLRDTNKVIKGKNVYELPSFNRLFVIGKPKYYPSLQADPGNSLKNILNALQKNMKKNTVNKANIGVPIEYLSSDETLLNRKMSRFRRPRAVGGGQGPQRFGNGSRAGSGARPSSRITTRRAGAAGGGRTGGGGTGGGGTGGGGGMGGY